MWNEDTRMKEEITEQTEDFEVRFVNKKIDYDFIKNLKTYTNQGLLKHPRNIRDSQVQRLFRLLREGKHWQVPVVVNYIYNEGVTTMGVSNIKKAIQGGRPPKQIHVIDGTHRIRAYEHFFHLLDNRNKVFNQMMAIYTDLNEEQERLVYERWNAGLKQNNRDWVKVNLPDILLWRKIKHDNNFPIKSITVGKVHSSSLDFVQLYFALGAVLLYDYFEPSVPGFNQLRGYNQIHNEKMSNKIHYKNLKDFLTFFERRFGLVGKNNIWQKNNLFFPIIDIWFRNHGLIEEEKLYNLFAKIMGKKDFMDPRNLRSCRSLKMEMRDNMLDLLNKGNKGTKLK